MYIKKCSGDGVVIIMGCCDNRPRKIAVFGSSVASGGADDTALKGGYAGRLKELIEPRGWTLVNVSVGGDNTVTIQPRVETDLFPQEPGYVVIGLSLANEGLLGMMTDQDQEKLCQQFKSGIQTIIRQTRERGMQPVVGLCYAQSDFTVEQYACVRRTNLEINGWDVPSINFLGTIEDGLGNWVPACQWDPGHPNSLGHEEMFHAIVPTLFDALAAGKPIPQRVCSEEGIRLDSQTQLTFTPGDAIHSFAVGFHCKPAGQGTVASVKHEKGRVEFDVKDGKLLYRTVEGEIVPAGDVGQGVWVQVVLSHRYLKGETLIFVDGKLTKTVTEKFIPTQFVLGGSKDAQYRQWLVYRSSLNADEARALYDGQLLQASLEIYAPLVEKSLSAGLANLAQSLSAVEITRRGQ